MRVGNLAGRAVLLAGDGATGIEKAVGGRLPADPQVLFEHWDDGFDAAGVVAEFSPTVAGTRFSPSISLAPVRIHGSSGCPAWTTARPSAGHTALARGRRRVPLGGQRPSILNRHPSTSLA